MTFRCSVALELALERLIDCVKPSANDLQGGSVGVLGNVPRSQHHDLDWIFSKRCDGLDQKRFRVQHVLWGQQAEQSLHLSFGFLQVRTVLGCAPAIWRGRRRRRRGGLAILIQFDAGEFSH